MVGWCLAAAAMLRRARRRKEEAVNGGDFVWGRYGYAFRTSPDLIVIARSALLAATP
jgi:hypothetical protein